MEEFDKLLLQLEAKNAVSRVLLVAFRVSVLGRAMVGTSGNGDVR